MTTEERAYWNMKIKQRVPDMIEWLANPVGISITIPLITLAGDYDVILKMERKTEQWDK